MSISIILYGSRARSDSGAASDTDLLLADRQAGLGNPVELGGVSLHHYPQPWLLEEAENGNLFVLHVGFEGVALHDPDDFLTCLRDSCQPKPCYVPEVEAATAAALATMRVSWRFDPKIRRRFFWAIRTILIARSAELGRLVFDTKELERLYSIDGVADVVKSRLVVGQSKAVEVGRNVVAKLGTRFNETVPQEELLAWLAAQGGIAFNTARLLGELEASALSGSLYE